MKNPPCLGCPPCCRTGCTWDNKNAKPAKAKLVLVDSKEYGCIHGGEIVRTEDGRVGIDRSGGTFTGFSPLTDQGREFLITTRPELAQVLGLQG